MRVAQDGTSTTRRVGGIKVGDRVRLQEGLQQLKNGGLQTKTNLFVDIASGVAGRVKDFGPQYGGDVLVEWAGGRSLWYSPAELLVM